MRRCGGKLAEIEYDGLQFAHAGPGLKPFILVTPSVATLRRDIRSASGGEVQEHFVFGGAYVEVLQLPLSGSFRMTPGGARGPRGCGQALRGDGYSDGVGFDYGGAFGVGSLDTDVVFAGCA
jgi:hypothetical protein